MAVNIQCTQVAASTSAGTQDITISGFGTPKAAIFSGTDDNDNTIGNDAVFIIGFTDGTSQNCLSYWSGDNAGAVDSYSRTQTNRLWELLSATTPTTDGYATFNSWITDGIKINWGENPSTAKLINVILIGGTDLSVDVGQTQPSTQDTEVDVTAPGFNPDLVLAFAAQASNHAHIAIGASDGTTQRGWTCFDYDTSDPSDIRGAFSETYAVDFRGASTDDYSVDISNFDSSGFSIYARRAAGLSSDVCWMALNFNSALSAEIGTYTTPTSTGSDSVSGLSIQPDFLMLGTSMFSSVDTEQTAGEAGGNGLYIAESASADYHAMFCAEDAQARSDTKAANFLNLEQYDDSGANPYTATLTSFDSNGWTFNFSAVNSTARKTWYVAFGNAPGPVTVKQSGGDYTTLNGAFSAGETLISIEGTWTSADTTSATCSTSNTIVTADADSKHNGYIESSPSYYRLALSTDNYTLNLNTTCTISDIVIKGNTAGGSDVVRASSGTDTTLTINNLIIYAPDPAQNTQRGISVPQSRGSFTWNVNQCHIFGFDNAGEAITCSTTGNATDIYTININSCTFYGNTTNIELQANGSESTLTWNIQNVLAVGGESQDYLEGTNTATVAWNISNSIDSDGTIADVIDTGSGNIYGATATDDASPGFKPAVIFNDITTYPYDLRLKKAVR